MLFGIKGAFPGWGRFVVADGKKGCRVDINAGLLDPNIPMHHQMYVQLRMEIADGLWIGKPDFPGEEELARQFDVSVITSRKTLDRLAADGLIRRERGRRPIVTFTPNAAEATFGTPTVFPISARPFGYEVISVGITQVPAEACLALEAEAGTPLWQCARLRHFETRRHSVSINVQLPDFGERHKEEELSALAMRDILERAGRPLVHLERKVGVGIPSRLVASNLQVPLLQSLLVYSYIARDKDERPIEWVRIFLHPDEQPPMEVLDLSTNSWESLEII
jgi:GntR family transcriptional regulator